MRKAVIIIILGLFITPFNVFAYGTDYQYIGQEFNNNTGTYNFNNREYDPSTGRFLQQDPFLKDGSLSPYFMNNATTEDLNKLLSNPQKLNPYSYANNNPLIYVDPNGLDSYVFYDPDDFSNQANEEADRLQKKYNEPAYLKPITTSNQFFNEWGNMNDTTADIDETSLLFHGDAHNITINYDNQKKIGEYLTINPNSKTTKGSAAKYLGDLAKKAIGVINLFICNSGDIYSPTNLASFLSQNQNTTVYGWDGYLSYSNDTPRPSRTSNVFFTFMHGFRPPFGLVKYLPNGFKIPQLFGSLTHYND
ncbi:MAG: RHS repeat-associated core domain-containing protein [Candidatus Komeilibacteria bacterium]|nr:RHS repeat-associated core domain-containing protein [Candidatus Komeilibacteria bacterium]